MLCCRPGCGGGGGGGGVYVCEQETLLGVPAGEWNVSKEKRLELPG